MRTNTLLSSRSCLGPFKKKKKCLCYFWCDPSSSLSCVSCPVFPSHQKVTLCLPALCLPQLLPLWPWLWVFFFFFSQKTSNFMTEWHVQIIKFTNQRVATSQMRSCCVISKITVSPLASGRTFFRTDVQKCILNLSAFIRACREAFN